VLRLVVILGALALVAPQALAPEDPLFESAVLFQAPAPATPAPSPSPPPTPPPGTDLYELAFDGSLDALKSSKPSAITREPGYENQPFYTPDGAAMLFTAHRDGKQTDIYEFDRKTRRTRALTATPEGEYSATLTPNGTGVSVIRVEADATQRLWRFDRNGSNPRLVLADIKPVGYHAWIDDDQLALFVLGTPSTLQHARVSTGKAVVIAQNIGRSLHRIPETRTVSFVHRESPEHVWVKQFDPATGTVTPLVQLRQGNDERDVAWTPDGTLLMSAATKIFAWRRGDTAWREVYDAAPHQLGAITRMAVAPDGRAIALVVNEPAR
jgi:Tol biopolymer transport system component